MQLHLRDYQQLIVDKQKTSCFIIAKMGCGKTSATLTTLYNDIIRDKKYKKVLITAPLTVAKNVWDAEITKWDNFNQLNYVKCIGLNKQKVEAMQANAQITITNHDNLVWLVNYYNKTITKPDFDCVIIDESSCFKNPRSKRFKSLVAIKKYVPKWILLTGTPIPNSYEELWSQIFLIDKGLRLGRNITQYRRTYFNRSYCGFKWDIKDYQKGRIRDKIKDITLVVSNYTGLPNINYINNTVELSTQHYKLYNEFKNKYIANFKSDLGDKEINATNAAVLINKLQQLANGAIYTDNPNEYLIFHDEKLDMLQNIIDNSNDNILVAYNYRHDYERIKNRFYFAKSISDTNAVADWNRGKIKLLLSNPSSASYGLNLQDGGNRIVWFCPIWSSEKREQFNARLYRQGQKSTVFVHTILCNNTVDFKILEALNNKEVNQTQLITRLAQIYVV